MTGFGHESPFKGETNSWITPKYIIDDLGPFDLDPCTCLTQPWKTADKFYTEIDDGLVQPWHGRVWMNPPYGPDTGKWLEKLAEHGNGIALVFARTETRMFFAQVWDKANALLFLKGRVKFFRPNGMPAGSGPAPSVLIAYGDNNSDILQRSKINGFFVRIR